MVPQTEKKNKIKKAGKKSRFRSGNVIKKKKC